MSLPLACGDRSGFLFAHACDRPAVGACATCGRPICIDHTRMGPAGPTCIACLRGDPADHDRTSTSIDHSGSSGSGSAAHAGEAEAAPRREGDFGGAGASAFWQQREGERAAAAEPDAAGRQDDPYFFGGGPDRTAYYDADDYRAFDAVTAAAAAESAGDAGEADAAPDTDTGAS